MASAATEAAVVAVEAMATPTSAVAREGASLMPSPTCLGLARAQRVQRFGAALGGGRSAQPAGGDSWVESAAGGAGLDRRWAGAHRRGGPPTLQFNGTQMQPQRAVRVSASAHPHKEDKKNVQAACAQQGNTRKGKHGVAHHDYPPAALLEFGHPGEFLLGAERSVHLQQSMDARMQVCDYLAGVRRARGGGGGWSCESVAHRGAPGSAGGWHTTAAAGQQISTCVRTRMRTGTQIEYIQMQPHSHLLDPKLARHALSAGGVVAGQHQHADRLLQGGPAIRPRALQVRQRALLWARRRGRQQQARAGCRHGVRGA